MNATTDAKACTVPSSLLVVASLPIKNLAYVTPALYLLILWLHNECRVVGRVVILSSAVLSDFLHRRTVGSPRRPTVNFPGIWFGLVTYAPLLIVLCETFHRTTRPADVRQIRQDLRLVYLVSITIGHAIRGEQVTPTPCAALLVCWTGFVKPSRSRRSISRSRSLE